MSRRRGRRQRGRRKAATFGRVATNFEAPSVASIAAGCSLSTPEVRKALRELAAGGWVLLDGIPGDDSSPVRWHLTMPEARR